MLDIGELNQLIAPSNTVAKKQKAAPMVRESDFSGNRAKGSWNRYVARKADIKRALENEVISTVAKRFGFDVRTLRRHMFMDANGGMK